jgi:hypothetical protein
MTRSKGVAEARFTNLASTIESKKLLSKIIPAKLVFEAISGMEEYFKVESVELLATVLIKNKERMREIERSGGGASVRLGGVLSNSTVNVVAMNMLSTCLEFGSPPPDALLKLLSMQLDADVGPPEEEYVKRSVAKYEAFQLLLEDDETSFAEIARRVGVNRSSVTRWMKDKEFRRELDEARYLKYLSEKKALKP